MHTHLILRETYSNLTAYAFGSNETHSNLTMYMHLPYRSNEIHLKSIK